jgi:hypothetical protein
LSWLIRLSLESTEEMIAATQVGQRRLDGIEPGIQAPFLGNEHRASKRARHGITQRPLVPDLTPGRGDGCTDS